MSRPTKGESVYKVSIHKNGGYMYAATHPILLTRTGNVSMSTVIGASLMITRSSSQESVMSLPVWRKGQNSSFLMAGI